MVLMAITSTALLGFTGLAVESGLWYAIKRHDQSAADLAALSGAMEVAAGSPYNQSATNSGICGLAKRDAARNGFTFASGFTCPAATPGLTNPPTGKMYANNPPVLGLHVGDKSYVEVILAQQQNTLLASLFLPSVTIDTRAVAGVTVSGIACSLATWDNPTNDPAGTAINFSGTSASFNGCGFASNSSGSKSINFQGNATIGATWFETMGGYNTNGNPTFPNLTAKLVDANPTADPYSATCAPAIACASPITIPTISGAELTAPATGGTLVPGTYKTSKTSPAPMDFTSGTTILCPGLFVLDGEDNSDEAFAVSGSTTVVKMGTAGSGGCPANGSDGVTIIASSKAAKKAGGFVITAGTVTLSAPTKTAGLPTGIPAGLLFVQDPVNADVTKNAQGNEADSRITAGGTSVLTGTMYTPKTNVTFTGNSNSTCFIIIANTVLYTGASVVSGSLAACQALNITAPAQLNIALSE
jgi:hypothetical protein